MQPSQGHMTGFVQWKQDDWLSRTRAPFLGTGKYYYNSPPVISPINNHFLQFLVHFNSNLLAEPSRIEKWKLKCNNKWGDIEFQDSIVENNTGIFCVYIPKNANEGGTWLRFHIKMLSKENLACVSTFNMSPWIVGGGQCDWQLTTTDNRPESVGCQPLLSTKTAIIIKRRTQKTQPLLQRRRPTQIPHKHGTRAGQ
jgi:hypothetical protein